MAKTSRAGPEGPDADVALRDHHIPPGSRAGRGARHRHVRFSDSSGEVGFNLDYIEIPVLLVVGIPAGGLKIEFFAGPQVAFRTKCDIIATPTGGSTVTVACDDPLLGGVEVESTDFGILVGGGVAVGGFMAQVALDYGLTTLDAETDPDDVKNQAIYALIGWMFRLN